MTAPRKAVPAVTPRLAATTLVLRDGAAGLEVLMVKRSPHASFMPGAYVFPGGAVDDADGGATAQALALETAAAVAQRIGQPTGVGQQALAFAVAGLRECFEESGLWLHRVGGQICSNNTCTNITPSAWQTLRAAQANAARHHRKDTTSDPWAWAQAAGLTLDTAALAPWAHWVTPVGIPKRFDTLFFVAQAPADQTPSVDAGETTTLAWVHPPQALAEQAQGRFDMEFATVQTVRSLLPFAHHTTQAVLAHAHALVDLQPVHPRLRLDAQGHIVGVLLPGDVGYAEAAGEGV